MNKNMTLYVERPSPIHRIDPLTKLLFVVLSVVSTYMMQSHLFAVGAVLLACFVLWIGNVFKFILPVIGLSLFLIGSILIIHGFFHPDRATILVEIGTFPIYKEGFSVALLLTLRLMNMLLSFGVLILTTKPSELVDALVQKGLSPRFGYVLLSVLQIIPQMLGRAQKITEAQRSRGLETEGSLWVRLKSFIPLLGPVVLNGLSETRERSLALEARGFNVRGKRTSIQEPIVYAHSVLVRALLCTAFMGVVFWRLFV
ncbi:energy-coupling factor transporter transmembrane component T [Sporosarcina saromensis]|uniref:Energy-coupling factor transporter transmembrane component T n=1 Tax=Sporosarcina saromensis TaxID=359365 RepID=A0ABU4G6H7_9BACL|nr:energy-coupling factor transporter transmembrane component T [Sporosarcina saromensis]MDW0112546.1 energy-coupling factor transporter transmembrane component T [Sporosarcina saromensis]